MLEKLIQRSEIVHVRLIKDEAEIVDSGVANKLVRLFFGSVRVEEDSLGLAGLAGIGIGANASKASARALSIDQRPKLAA